jgi:hypothetical protein
MWTSASEKDAAGFSPKATACQALRAHFICDVPTRWNNLIWRNVSCLTIVLQERGAACTLPRQSTDGSNASSTELKERERQHADQ